MAFHRSLILTASCCLAILLTACGGGSGQPSERGSIEATSSSGPDTTDAVLSLSSFAPKREEPPSADTVELQKEGGRLNALELARIAQTGVLPDPFDGPLLSGAASSKAQGQAKAATPTVAYRFYNTRTSAHFFTTSVAERDNVINTLSSIMNYEGPAFYASATSGAGLSPVHRFYNTQTGVHFYTISETERAHVVASLPQFTYEGIAYYASTQAGAGFTPLYRFFLASKGFHFYSNSSTERDNIIANLPQYTYEGIGYYVLDSGPAPVPPLPAKHPKRGIAYNLSSGADYAALAPGVSWWYNWSSSPSGGTPGDLLQRYGMNFVPMLWNGNFNDASIVQLLRDNPQIRHMLVLNEPNLTDQSNLTPTQAAAIWPRFEAIAKATGVQIVGPQLTWGTMPGFSDPVAWMDAFYIAYRAANGGRDPQIDALGFHWYDYGLNDQLNRLTRYGKPFWVTEFANWHRGAGPHIDSFEKQIAQMTDMVGICESRPDVHRYAWFTGRGGVDLNDKFTSLLAGDGELTTLGSHYLALNP